MPPLALIGSYTVAPPCAPAVLRVDSPTGTSPTVATGVVHQPSYLALHAASNTIYSVSETDQGSIVALQVQGSNIVEIDRVSSLGSHPCHLSCSDNAIFASNYSSGEVVRYELLEDGTFGGLTGQIQLVGRGPHERQESPHPHCATLGPDKSYLYVCDLGTDKVVLLPGDHESKFEVQSTLSLTPGSGPRHIAFHPSQDVAFVVCELDNSLEVLHHDPSSGHLERHQTSLIFPSAHKATSLAAAIRVHPSGTRIYISNRGDHSIATFAFDEKTRRCELVGTTPCGGSDPRDVVIEPSGSSILVANQSSNSITRLPLHPETLIPQSPEHVAEFLNPTSILLWEAHR